MIRAFSPFALLRYFFFAAVLIVLFLFLLQKTRSIDVEGSNRIRSTLAELKQADVEWSLNVLRAKTGLHENYDRIANPLPIFERLGDTLGEDIQAYWQPYPETQAKVMKAVKAYSDVLANKVEAVEQFKSRHAILRNSTRYLPEAASDVLGASESAAISSEQKNQIKSLVANLLVSIMNFTETSEGRYLEQLTTYSEALAEMVEALPSPLNQSMRLLVSHANTLVNQHVLGDALMAEVNRLPVGAMLDQVSEAHAEGNVALHAGVEVYRHALVTYSFFLLCLLAYLGRRLWRSMKALAQANVDLKQAHAALNKAHSELNDAHAELKEQHLYLVQAEKMSALGQMVAGIAHEINTPLAYVRGSFGVIEGRLGHVTRVLKDGVAFSALMNEKVRDKPALSEAFKTFSEGAKQVVTGDVLGEMKELLGNAIHGVDQISEIVLNLKNFSRLDKEKVSHFSVESGLDSTLLLANNLIKNRVKVVKDYAKVPMISGSPSQINQVFLNLITNAVQSIAPNQRDGLLQLSTRLDKRRSEIVVCISDNGVGIEADALPYIFDPFFTTKAVGEGTGMGLSISYKIIKEHGGSLSVKETSSAGTTFEIRLPYEAATSSEGKQRPEAAANESLFVD